MAWSISNGSFFYWYQIPKDQDFQDILTRVKNFPSACPQWLWGSNVRIQVYDPEYMKLILGRSGESETPSPLWIF